jgi:hypothetical protein
MKKFKFRIIEYWIGGEKPERILEVEARTEASAERKVREIQGNRDWQVWPVREVKNG